MRIGLEKNTVLPAERAPSKYPTKTKLLTRHFSSNACRPFVRGLRPTRPHNRQSNGAGYGGDEEGH